MLKLSEIVAHILARPWLDFIQLITTIQFFVCRVGAHVFNKSDPQDIRALYFLYICIDGIGTKRLFDCLVSFRTCLGLGTFHPLLRLFDLYCCFFYSQYFFCMFFFLLLLHFIIIIHFIIINLVIQNYYYCNQNMRGQIFRPLYLNFPGGGGVVR